MASHPPPFFERFPGFRPNPSAPVSDEFSRLASHMNWNTKSKKYREMWLKCIYLEFHRHYGNESSLLEPWQRLCRELQIEAFQSISQCKTAVAKVYVNLVDLVDCRITGEAVQTFPTLKALKTYTRNTGRFFPKIKAKEDGFIRVLLKPLL